MQLRLPTNNLRTHRLHRSGLAIGGYRRARLLAERFGVQFVIKTFYSPIPSLRDLPDEVWSRKTALAGVELNLGAQVAYLETELAPFTAEELDVEKSLDTAGASYGVEDERILYAMVRHARPRRIIELGSGRSTSIMDAALRRNAAEGSKGALAVYDPFVAESVRDLQTVTSIRRLAAETLDPSAISGLDEQDILFVDTTHVVRLAGDVNQIILEILPRLRPGVLVHFHDIFLPNEYPRVWSEDFGLYWTEQYLLQAFLAFNAHFEVVFAAHAASRQYPERFRRALGSRGDTNPAAFWIRARGHARCS
jgi:predicted O-methyltransferase YrrM